MANEIGNASTGMNKARVESFSDGVFAFAITLLVLSITVPDLKVADDQLLASALLRAIPQLVPYVTSFATIGIIWLNHHSMFHEVEKVKHTTLTLNLLLLLVVAFIPYPTSVVGRYGALRSAVVLYGATFTAAGLAFTALWFDIRRNRLSREREDHARIRLTTIRNLIGPVIYPAATALAFRAPKTSLGIFFGLAAFYFLPGLQPRRNEGP
jgi:TMEM175 potassium channel family protein